MGKDLEFNWVLKLPEKDIPKDFKRGSLEKFSKNGERIYPRGLPILLADEKWNVFAMVSIRDYHIQPGLTYGNYIIEKVLNNKERIVLSSIYREMSDYFDVINL
jgi:hypothetical protein